MSSVSISVSGQRALTSTINAPDHTSAQMPTKGDDNFAVSFGNIPGFGLLVPLDAKLERVKAKNGSEYLRLSAANDKSTSLNLYVVHGEPDEGGNPVGGWPHASISVGKHIHDPYCPGGTYECEVVEVIHERVGDLIPATLEA